MTHSHISFLFSNYYVKNCFSAKFIQNIKKKRYRLKQNNTTFNVSLFLKHAVKSLISKLFHTTVNDK